MGLVLLSGGSYRTLDEPLPWPTQGSGTVALHDGLAKTYADIYRCQPNVRTVVDFLARNIAQLGLHVFRRVSDTERERLSNHDVVDVIREPNPQSTRYRFVAATVSDFAIYDRAFWLKTRDKTGRLVLRRMPPQRVIVHGGTWLEPERFELFTKSGSPVDIHPDSVVFFRGYDPDGVGGTSPMETLRQLLAEDHAAGDYRRRLWQNGARMSGWIGRAHDAPQWGDGAKARFLRDFRAAWSGNSDGVGGTALLEDGMEFHEASFSAEQAQYVETRKLTREEVAAAYFIPPPMVGILDHATFSNITEQHKMLYQDTLGPWLTMLQEEIHLQLLPEFDDVANIYVEFNIAEKLKGSFEEQAAQLQTSIGAPWLTRNEGRARMNLDPIAGGDDLVTPLNVMIGGQASPTDSAPKARPLDLEPGALKALPSGKATRDRLRTRHQERIAEAVSRYTERQRRSVLSRLKSKDSTDDAFGSLERWDSELAATLLPLLFAASIDGAAGILEDFDPEADFDDDLMVPYLTVVATEQATATNVATLERLRTSLDDADDWRAAANHVFDVAAGTRAQDLGHDAGRTSWNLGVHDAARVVGLKTKTWRVRSSRPRSSHARLNGKAVPLDEEFSNGARWPGDRKLKLEERARCSCDLEVSR
jgi:HK97 family phage portal protein